MPLGPKRGDHRIKAECPVLFILPAEGPFERLERVVGVVKQRGEAGAEVTALLCNKMPGNL